MGSGHHAGDASAMRACGRFRGGGIPDDSTEAGAAERKGALVGDQVDIPVR
jgi:hypothetical protein